MLENKILNYIRDIVFELDGAIYGESIYKYYMRSICNSADICANLGNLRIIIKFPEVKYIDYFKNVISMFYMIEPYIAVDYICLDTFYLNINNNIRYDIIILPFTGFIPELPEFAIDIINIEMSKRGLVDNRANPNFYNILNNIMAGKFTYYIDRNFTNGIYISDIYDTIVSLIKCGYKLANSNGIAELYRYKPDMKNDICCTCSAEFMEDEIVIVSRCNHRFHWECDSGIKYWLRMNNTCPYCRCEKFV